MVRKVFELVLARMHDGNEVGTQTAEATLFLQFDGVFWFDDV